MNKISSTPISHYFFISVHYSFSSPTSSLSLTLLPLFPLLLLLRLLLLLHPLLRRVLFPNTSSTPRRGYFHRLMTFYCSVCGLPSPRNDPALSLPPPAPLPVSPASPCLLKGPTFLSLAPPLSQALVWLL